ncbi:hypothetical protein D3H65_04080 [Paraflavitalea soli]|uniref:Uncharacterized protein n=1 Tax=Paraflavitalea soli TaxID=2315862 RepID=A0A3B7MRM8_9BACT|nr:hypothetical protein [Paraflavitalea soli]AXY73201.1 hypothetical protein D3H65_04080 [Paraflavitalea soli]
MITQPTDCVLAIGFSTDPDQLMSELSATHKDFAKSIKRNGRANDQDLYEKLTGFTGLYKSNIAAIRALGVTVLENFTASDARQLPPCQSLTVLAHFKPPTVLPEDILDAGLIEQAIMHQQDLFGPVPREAPDSKRKLTLWESLNELLKDTAFYKRAGLSTFITEHEERTLPLIYIRYLNRLALESIFFHALAKGCLVELYDGLYTVQEIVGMIPSTFIGPIDISICHSIIVQDEVQRVQPRRHAFGVEHPLSLDFKIIFYKGLMQKLALEPKDYITAYFELLTSLKKNLQP